MNTLKLHKLGIDIGSTTVKIAILDEQNTLVFSDYERHFANIRETLTDLLHKAYEKLGQIQLCPMITGSGGLTLAKHLDVPFVQEVIAVSTALQDAAPQTDVAIELGGEDAKIIYFEGGNVEQRMNGICAGGTGSFIDQMASLIQTDASGLNEYAKNYKAIYPIAARCGVFAKTDIQPLINEGATREDLSASIFQAVVNQTISGLACGKPIRGHVAFLGGPLHFLSELKEAFIRTLKLDEEHTIVPENSHLFAAIGSALNYKEENQISLEDLLGKLKGEIHMEFEVERMDPLFADQAAYDEFTARHNGACVKKGDISTYSGNCYLGIDAGSTTTKVALVAEDGTLLYSFYSSNNGSPLATSIIAIKEIYEQLPKDAHIVSSCSTGYGEALVKAALMLDEGEVETVAHYTAAAFFDPKVDCILDIGGQDMKCIKIKNNTVDSVQLNEACSSGCGSFIETFAKSLNYSVQDFAKEALFAKNPIDLGTRCTVFMNSKVKQAQKEGASVADISAGLAYSVIKNALFKVIKLSDPTELGQNIVVQGGTFYNDAVLRSFETISGCKAIRPDIAGIMGAFGAALIARDRYEGKQTTMLSIEQINDLKFETKLARCGGCTNNCLLTINKFSGNRQYITGNRCEKGEGIVNSHKDLPNLVKYKYDRIFGYTSLEEKDAPRGTIGIPRVLNMYEDYPFWFTLFTNLGFRVIISEKSTRKIYEKGIESMPSESVCYPAKLSHGHVISLIQNGIKTIFYPCIPYSRKEYEDANNRYNCPIVISYSEVLKNNIEELKSEDIKFINPFLPFESKALLKRMMELPEFKEYNFNKKELKNAIEKAQQEYQKCRQDIHDKGKETIEYIEKNNLKGIVLAGRPYHVDPEINHGIDTLITSLGMCVLTEDSVADKALPERPLRVVDQWMFHSRLYAAADFVGRHDNLELVQINSFGCGVDAVTTDEVEEILTSFGKMYTLIKIDEVNNLGAVRIRLRSLLASINKRLNNKKEEKETGEYFLKKNPFTEEMKKEYVILIPQMAPIHFDFIEPVLQSEGYKAKLLRECTQNTIETGLKYVNNDACYPSIITTGQMIEALESGEYDVNKTALIMSQTGGGCRATNYIGFIRKALKDAGFGQVPVISFNVVGMEKNPGFKLTLPLVEKLLKSMVYADLLQKMLYKNRAYEKNKGETDKLFAEWMEKAKKLAINSSSKEFSKSIYQMVDDFEKIEWKQGKEKPKVGIVGEILIKYHPFGNNYVANLLEKEGAEVVLPDFMGFVKYVAANGVISHQLLKNNGLKSMLFDVAIKLINSFEKDAKKALEKSKKGYLPTCDIWHLADNVKSVLSTGNQTGEGWFLTAEMLEYMENGIQNIVCVQPFACLPNHVVGKGVIKTIRDMFPDANIVPVDYDPGASEANQTNRIKLLMTVAKDNLKIKQKEKKMAEKENKNTTKV